MVRKNILLTLFLIPTLCIFSQVDNEFWLAPPSALEYNIGDEDDIEIVITAMQATTVTIEKPSTGWLYTTPVIGAFGSLSLSLGTDLGLNMTDIETPPQGLPINASNPAYNNGFKITSNPGLITVSYKLTYDKSQDQISLKGRNALGTDFMVSTQTLWPNTDNNYYNGFTIVATKDNTTIEIQRNDNWTAFPGPFPATETVVLNEGQTFTVQSLDNTAANHINGVRVTSDNEIAITYWDDQVSKVINAGGNTKDDFAGDQLVPIDILGQEYIVMRGGLGDFAGDGGESVFITGIVDGTVVEVRDWNGNLTNTFTINEGEVFYDTIDLESTYIYASETILVNHYSSIEGSQKGNSLAAAVLPPVGPCTGSHDVVITRSPHAGDRFTLNILAVNDTLDGSAYKNQAAENFFITTSAGTTQIPSNYFDYSYDSAYITLNDDFQVDFLGGSTPVIDVGQTALISNRVAKFHLGVIEGHENQGSKYGYFSDYGGQSAHSGIGGPDEDALHVQCSLNPVKLVASGGRSYQWWVDGVDSANSLNFLSALNVAEPIYYPDTFGVKIFKVRATQLCGGLYENTLIVHTVPQPIAFFDVEAEEVCSPDSILITHGVTSGNVNMDWYFNNAVNPGRQEISDVASPFYHVLPDNNGDTIYTYKIDLYVNYMGACSDVFSRTITVKPAINSDFEFIGDSIGCHPLIVNLKNLSSGNVDSTSYFWNFGDLSISYEEDSVEHTYNNYSLSDTTFVIQLITRSPFDCFDTSTAQVTVYPRVKALFSTTPNQGCSPLTVDINPINSVGADSLLWYIADSSFIYTNKNSFNITHTDTSIAAGIDTISIQLIAKNKYNCSDTALPHQILVYPDATADFSISSDIICDSDSITFENNSNGYNLDFFWDLGDGTAPNDSVPADKPYYNPTGDDIYYTISLTTISKHNCIDYMDTVLTVHPYLNANFGVNYPKNCSPLTVNITNNCVGAQVYDWDMGDGNTYTYSTDFSYTYLNPSTNNDTTYIIKLNVENTQGCKDSIERNLTVKPKVVALMDLTNNVGCSPLTTSFANNSTGGSYYIWELGGTNVRTDTAAVNFIESYANETANDISYLISLTARNDAGCDSTVYDTVKVLASILAGFTFNKDSSCSPFIPVITNRSSSGAKVFDWYRDGALFSSAKNPVIPEISNTGDSPDYYNYTLITYGSNDPEHKICADTHSAILTIFPELNADFTLDNLVSCQPLNTAITNNSYPNDSVGYIWYLDNYIYSDIKDPGNLFINNFTNTDNSHTFKLIGKTNHGCVDTDSINVTVYAYIDAKFSIDRPAICSGNSFNINRNNTRGAIDNYLWDLGGIPDTTSDVQFKYSFDNLTPDPVYETIQLTVSNANCDSTWINSILIYPQVTSNFDIPMTTRCHPHNTTLSNTSSNADYYSWNFGDGNSSNDTNPNHTFINFDPINDLSYDIQLIAESQYKCSDTIVKPLTVWASPNANFYLPKSLSCPPFDFSVINSSEGNTLSYLWNLGNEATSSEFEPITVFDNITSNPLIIPIDLRVTSINGCVDSISRNITVYPAVNVEFTASPTEGCSPLTINFSGDTTNVQQMVWYIDENLFSTQISPTNIFLNETSSDINHNVKIVAYSRYNCIDSSENSITVFPTPAADFLAGPVPAEYDTLNDQTIINFTNLSKYQDIWNYTWNFGDQNSGSQTSSQFEYVYGQHFWGKVEDNHKVPVQMLALNKKNPECRDSITREILILPPVPLVEIGENIAGCIPLTVDFSVYSKYAYNNSYEWNFGDGNITTGEQYPVHVFDRPGTYTVKVNVMGDGGPAADYKVITVYEQPEADFSFNDSIVMVASQTNPTDVVNFYNQTRNGLSYEWYFDSEEFFNGAGPNTTEKDPMWVYTEVGTYYPVLVAFSAEGCVDTLVHSIPIIVQGEGIIEFPTGFYMNPHAPAADEYNTDQGAGNLYLFYPKNSGIAEYRLEIYNRWGTLVFETTDVNHGWNGYIDGVRAKQDVYVWRARGRFTNGKPFDISGDVTLIVAPVNIGQ